jgi:hypothetical protein
MILAPAQEKVLIQIRTAQPQKAVSGQWTVRDQPAQA